MRLIPPWPTMHAPLLPGWLLSFWLTCFPTLANCTLWKPHVHLWKALPPPTCLIWSCPFPQGHHSRRALYSVECTSFYVPYCGAGGYPPSCSWAFLKVPPIWFSRFPLSASPHGAPVLTSFCHYTQQPLATGSLASPHLKHCPHAEDNPPSTLAVLCASSSPGTAPPPKS